jgi:hypothetical protein
MGASSLITINIKINVNVIETEQLQNILLLTEQIYLKKTKNHLIFSPTK